MHNTTIHYTTLITPHHNYNCNCNYTTLIALHYSYNSTTLQLQLQYATLHYNYNYNCTKPHCIQQLWWRDHFKPCNQTLLHRSCYKQELLHTETFTHRRFYTQTLLHTEAFTHRRFYTQTLDTFTHIGFYTQTPLHRHFYTQTLLHANTFTYRHFYTQTHLHTDAFTHRSVYTQTLLQTDVKAWRCRSADVRVWRCRSADVRVWRCRSADVRVWRCRSADVKVWRCRSADVRVWRCRSADVRVWRCRSADVKVWRCRSADVKVWRCRSADVRVWRCRSADVKVWRCRSADVRVWRCRSADVRVWRCRSADVKVWRCRSADVKVWRCRSADVKVWRCRSADVKVWRCITTAAFLRRTLRRRSREQLQPPASPSVDSLCHPWFTTTNLSYRLPIFETSATALCGTTGILYILYFIFYCILLLHHQIVHISYESYESCLFTYIYIYTSTCNIHMWNKWVSVSHTFFPPLGSHWSNMHSPLCKSLISRYEAIIWGVSILLERFRKYRSNKSTFTNEGSASSPIKSFEHLVKEIVYQQTSTDVNPQTAEHQWKICSQGRHRTRDPVSSSPMHTTQSQCASCTSQRVSTVMEWTIWFTSIILSETGSNSKNTFQLAHLPTYSCSHNQATQQMRTHRTTGEGNYPSVIARNIRGASVQIKISKRK